MQKTIISWATHTENVVHGCSKPIERDPTTGRRFLSPECDHCYAETLSKRRGWTPLPWTEQNEAANITLKIERIANLRKLAVKPISNPPSERERIFICSMGDIFHRVVPDAFLDQLFAAMAATPHIYQLLTKRPERAAQWPGPWPAHVWLGTTCGSSRTKFRIDHLKRSAAKVRFISAEPLLDSLLPLDLAGVDQVIVGGESGGGYRPMNMRWAREIRDACEDQGVAFFMKQDASFRTETRCYLVEEDGRRLEYRQFPGEMTPPVEVGATPFRILTPEPAMRTAQQNLFA